MNALDVFQYEDFPVRVVTDEHGEPWFVANDVASVLGVQNIRQVIASLDPDDVSTAYVTDALGREQPTRTVDEAGLYALIFQSRKQQAKAFQRWVTHEVLPQIRRTGSYVAPVEDDATLVARALVAAQGMLSAKDAQIAELEPRAEAFDVFLSADGDYLVGDAAKMLARAGVDTGPQRLFEQLHGFGWTFRGGDGKWRAKQSAVNDGYLVEKPMSHHHPRTGELIADAPQVRVTPRGLERLRVRLGRNSLTLVS